MIDNNQNKKIQPNENFENNDGGSAVNVSYSLIGC